MPEYHPGHGHRERDAGDPRSRFKFMRPGQYYSRGHFIKAIEDV
ncbi:unnamed protein product [Haemonchus placei]|uniref:Fumarate hydratase n=1 Tax=Haemonchus placei TaxID=6290 RepID=A0A0N4WTR8_HAEPC|nr:unnamed protein product [Haemonchus placei]